jgi:hypothetical protein
LGGEEDNAYVKLCGLSRENKYRKEIRYLNQKMNLLRTVVTVRAMRTLAALPGQNVGLMNNCIKNSQENFASGHESSSQGPKLLY